MRIEEFITRNVNTDGTVVGGGAVTTTGGLRIGRGKGCGVANCHCSDGYWVSIIMPLKKRCVKGIKITFRDREEMLEAMGCE